MTREQLIRKRKRKKALRLGLRVGAAAAVVVLVVILIRTIVRHVGSGRSGSTDSTESVEIETVSTDTVQTVALGSGMTGGSVGWNVNDYGWWYQIDDATMFANGWKTINGIRYYFKDDGYMATGWVNTGEIKDTYFDASGRVDESKVQKLVALTYDDGPTEAHTDGVLDALSKYGQKGTFFVVGEMAETNPDQLKREVELGMEVGSHTYDHPWLNSLSASEIEDEMTHNDEVINSIAGVTPELMRPTGGGLSETMFEVITKPMIQWDVDTLDWDHKDDDATYQAIVDGVQDGSVVLMHDLWGPSADAADRYLSWLIDNDYKCVTISELAEAYGYDLEPAGVYYAFYPEGMSLNKTKEEALASYSEDDEDSEDEDDES